MSTESEESRQIVASLAHRVGNKTDPAHIVEAIVATLQDMDAALTPIIGQQGVVALYRRSLYLCASTHPRLAGTHQHVRTDIDLTALKSMLVKQNSTEACLFGEELLKTFYELLTTLVGPSLTEHLLRSVWENSLSGAPAQDTSP
ncbi:hypothetical protein [Pseudomonas sp. CCC2.2]|uniref:hypothetical protein n=1 Tax=Pseudomonas sp. CCC2.2 TaxID=3048605 RepID=UPI002B237507|nr:hypothetical protein [Pseudomonas sp. CCC2.2]MEB0147677.1 hypothetical protein [Pseudomonas sp. CCC2.2]